MRPAISITQGVKEFLVSQPISNAKAVKSITTYFYKEKLIIINKV